jgi:hypothetical protein
MRDGEALERSEVNQAEENTALAVRRRFLIDLAWPMETTDLADMFGLPPTSADVSCAEVAESHAAIRHLVDTLPGDLLLGPAADMAVLLAALQCSDEDTLAAWLLSYSLAVISMLEGLE